MTISTTTPHTRGTMSESNAATPEPYNPTAPGNVIGTPEGVLSPDARAAQWAAQMTVAGKAVDPVTGEWDLPANIAARAAERAKWAVQPGTTIPTPTGFTPPVVPTPPAVAGDVPILAATDAALNASTAVDVKPATMATVPVQGAGGTTADTAPPQPVGRIVLAVHVSWLHKELQKIEAIPAHVLDFFRNHFIN